MRLFERLRCFSPKHLLRSSGSSPVMLFAERSRRLSRVKLEKFPKMGPDILELERSRELTRPSASHPTPCQLHGEASDSNHPSQAPLFIWLCACRNFLSSMSSSMSSLFPRISSAVEINRSELKPNLIKAEEQTCKGYKDWLIPKISTEHINLRRC